MIIVTVIMTTAVIMLKLLDWLLSPKMMPVLTVIVAEAEKYHSVNTGREQETYRN